MSALLILAGFIAGALFMAIVGPGAQKNAEPTQEPDWDEFDIPKE